MCASTVIELYGICLLCCRLQKQKLLLLLLLYSVVCVLSSRLGVCLRAVGVATIDFLRFYVNFDALVDGRCSKLLWSLLPGVRACTVWGGGAVRRSLKEQKYNNTDDSMSIR